MVAYRSDKKGTVKAYYWGINRYFQFEVAPPQNTPLSELNAMKLLDCVLDEERFAVTPFEFRYGTIMEYYRLSDTSFRVVTDINDMTLTRNSQYDITLW